MLRSVEQALDYISTALCHAQIRSDSHQCLNIDCGTLPRSDGHKLGSLLLSLHSHNLESDSNDAQGLRFYLRVFFDNLFWKVGCFWYYRAFNTKILTEPTLDDSERILLLIIPSYFESLATLLHEGLQDCGEIAAEYMDVLIGQPYLGKSATASSVCSETLILQHVLILRDVVSIVLDLSHHWLTIISCVTLSCC